MYFVQRCTLGEEVSQQAGWGQSSEIGPAWSHFLAPPLPCFWILKKRLNLSGPVSYLNTKLLEVPLY